MKIFRKTYQERFDLYLIKAKNIKRNNPNTGNLCPLCSSSQGTDKLIHKTAASAWLEMLNLDDKIDSKNFCYYKPEKCGNWHAGEYRKQSGSWITPPLWTVRLPVLMTLCKNWFIHTLSQLDARNWIKPAKV